MRKCVCSRAFLMSFFCTVLVLLFVFGMLMVDAEGRRLSFNDNAPPAEMLYQADGKAFLKINAFELDARIPVTGAVKVWRFFEKFFCLPKKFISMMERYGDNPIAMRDAGIAYAVDQIVDLAAGGVDGIHLYTMNNPYIANRIYESVFRLMAS